jgi:uncharacterized protein
MSYRIAKYFKASKNINSLIRGALLHDYFLYDWHKGKNRKKLHGFRHPGIAVKMQNRYWS